MSLACHTNWKKGTLAHCMMTIIMENGKLKYYRERIMQIFKLYDEDKCDSQAMCNENPVCAAW